MKDFYFNSATALSMGKGIRGKLKVHAEHIINEGPVLIVTDATIKKAGIAGKIESALKEMKVPFSYYTDIKSNPSARDIDGCAAEVTKKKARCIIAAGGGSVIDTAKMASAVCEGDLAAEEYGCMKHVLPGRKIGLIAVPTTSGTGAEVTSTSIFNDSAGRKVWGWSGDLTPDLALLDPECTAGLPPYLTAATGLDAIVHAVEAATGKQTNPVISALAVRAVELAAEGLSVVMKEPEDLDARGKLSAAAAMAGIAIEGGGTGTAHCIGHALASSVDIHHGHAVASALGIIIGRQTDAAADEYRRIGEALNTGLGKIGITDPFPDTYRRLLKDCGLSLSLKEQINGKVTPEELYENMLSDENRPMRENNCRIFSNTEMKHIAQKMIEF